MICTVENELSANPANCKQYYRCLSGQQILFSCTDGKVYNPTTRRCISSDLFSCDDQEPTSTTVTPSSLCHEKPNGIVSHASDCDKYVVCEEGIERIHSCPQGQQFSWKKLSCAGDNSCDGYFSDARITLEEVVCRRQTQALAAHPYDPDVYVDCAQETLRTCEADMIFRSNYQRCLPGDVGSNQLRSVSPNCGAFGTNPHPYLCEKYFKCVFWLSSLKSCPAGQIYSALEGGQCVAGDFQTCTREA
uniref:Chitin-binding type-2 domain-containing protein n=1 Tax=Anopheles dirus TaxID=7168 RepID=A0A182NVS1_9DIPT